MLLKWDDFQRIFRWFAHFVNFIGGWASDKVGPKTVFLVAALLWSVFLWDDQGHRVMDYAAVRVYLAGGRRPVSAAGNKIINNWIRVKNRQQPSVFFGAGSPLRWCNFWSVVGLLAISLAGVRRLGLFSCLVWHGSFSGTSSPVINRQKINVLPLEERVDFENHDDIILADDGKAIRLLLATTWNSRWYGDDAGISLATTIFSSFSSWHGSCHLNHSLHLDIKEISIANVIPWVIGAIGMVYGRRMFWFYLSRYRKCLCFRRCLIIGVCLAGAAFASFWTVTTMVVVPFGLMSVSSLCFIYLTYLLGCYLMMGIKIGGDPGRPVMTRAGKYFRDYWSIGKPDSSVQR